MAHEVTKMAYASGVSPWHLSMTRDRSTELDAHADFDTWIIAAGADTELVIVPNYHHWDGALVKAHDFAIINKTTGEKIHNCSDRYYLHQPRAIFETFRDLCHDQGLRMKTGGLLKGGAYYWAMAETTQTAKIALNDHRNHVLLYSSADGTLATDCKMTNICVVCNNTLQYAAIDRSDDRSVRTTHTSEFNPTELKYKMGLIDLDKSWLLQTEQLQLLADTPMSDSQAADFFLNLLRPPEERLPEATPANHKAESLDPLLAAPVTARNSEVATDKVRLPRGLNQLIHNYYTAPGASPGNAYGALQAVTRYQDFDYGRSVDSRLRSSWFGAGASRKDTAFQQLLDMAA